MFQHTRRIEKWRCVQISIFLTCFFASCQHVNSYSSGADPSVCDTMIPGHGGSSQNGAIPYSLALSNTAVSGYDTVDIILSGKETDSFVGFLIQVRKVGGDGKATGEFKEEATGNAGPLDCFERTKSAITHTSKDVKKNVTVQWIAPNDEDAEYEVFYSVVKDFLTFWTRIVHGDKIRVTRNSNINTTPAPVGEASEPLLGKWREVYGGCGDTKGCFGMPGKCVELYDEKSNNPRTCDIMVTWSNMGGRNVYQLTGNPGASQGYVALGLSEDQFMGKDSVVGCVISSPNANPTVERFHNVEDDKINKKADNSRLGLTPINQLYIDGHIFCQFEQQNHQLEALNVDFTKSYYLLLSKAPRASEGALPKHPSDRDKSASPESVHISDTYILGASSNNWLIQLHGGLMVIAWLLCASTGMFTARYFKLTHTDFSPFGKAFWFSLHVFCMCSTVFLTICGAVFILIKKKGLYLKETHPILGVITIGLAFLQVIIAFLRPHPGTPSRSYFNWFHWTVGNSAHIVGIVCILFASELSLADLKRIGDENLWGFVLLGIVLFHVLMHVVMSIHTLWADKQMDSSNKKRAMHPGPMKSNGLNGEAPGTGFRTFMLALYLLVMTAGAILLTLLVFWPKSDLASSTS